MWSRSKLVNRLVSVPLLLLPLTMVVTGCSKETPPENRVVESKVPLNETTDTLSAVTQEPNPVDAPVATPVTTDPTTEEEPTADAVSIEPVAVEPEPVLDTATAGADPDSNPPLAVSALSCQPGMVPLTEGLQGYSAGAWVGTDTDMVICVEQLIDSDTAGSTSPLDVVPVTVTTADNRELTLYVSSAYAGQKVDIQLLEGEQAYQTEIAALDSLGGANSAGSDDDQSSLAFSLATTADGTAVTNPVTTSDAKEASSSEAEPVTTNPCQNQFPVSAIYFMSEPPAGATAGICSPTPIPPLNSPPLPPIIDLNIVVSGQSVFYMTDNSSILNTPLTFWVKTNSGGWFVQQLIPASRIDASPLVMPVWNTQ